MKSIYKKIVFALALLISALSVEAAYYYRGNNMLYDSDRDVTWLMDLNYTCTSNPLCTLASQGRMTWSGAQQFASNLVYNGISGWRLPSANLVNDFTWSNDGTTDRGYNNTRSDLGNLWYSVLGNKGYCDSDAVDIATDCPQAGWGMLNFSVADAETGSIYNFINFKGPYWLAEENPDDTTLGFYFNTTRGYQNYELPKAGRNYVALLADGDVANVTQVPLPSALWLFGSAIAGLFLKRKNLFRI